MFPAELARATEMRATHFRTRPPTRRNTDPLRSPGSRRPPRAEGATSYAAVSAADLAAGSRSKRTRIVLVDRPASLAAPLLVPRATDDPPWSDRSFHRRRRRRRRSFRAVAGAGR